MREHTQVYRLVNDPRRSFAWLGAKKDEGPGGVYSSRAGA